MSRELTVEEFADLKGDLGMLADVVVPFVKKWLPVIEAIEDPTDAQQEELKQVFIVAGITEELFDRIDKLAS